MALPSSLAFIGAAAPAGRSFCFYNPRLPSIPSCRAAKTLHVCNAPARFEAARAANRPQLLVTPRPSVQYGENLPKVRGWRGAMDELIGRLVADVGIDRATAQTAVGIILDFLVKEGPADKVQPLLAKLPGAEALIQRAADAGGGGLGGAMGGVMGTGMRLMSAGLSMGQVQSVTRAVIAYTREKAGEDAVGEIVAAIPGLAQFV